MSTPQFQQLHFGTPLVLDLNDNGVLSQSVASGVHFDLFASGQQTATGWTDPGDGFLVLDRNHDGSISDGSELFGDSTLMSSGKRASNGYEALAELDSDHNGRISRSDINFAELKVWTDTNSNGLTDAGELFTLQEMGIESLDLQATSTAIKENGNTIGLVSSFEDTSGTSRTMADVWFVTDKQNVTATAAKPILTVEPTPMQAGVFGLVDAMAAFGQSEASRNFDLYGDGFKAAASVNSIDRIDKATLSHSTTHLAQALSQFDANGRPLTRNATDRTLMGLAQSDEKPRDPANGFLAIGNG